MAEVKVKKVCNTCGSDDVVKDAWASWDEEKQDWVLHNVFDEDFCENCEGSTTIIDEPIKTN